MKTHSESPEEISSSGERQGATGESWHAAVGNVEARILGSGDVGLLTTPGVVDGEETG